MASFTFVGGPARVARQHVSKNSNAGLLTEQFTKMHGNTTLGSSFSSRLSLWWCVEHRVCLKKAKKLIVHQLLLLLGFASASVYWQCCGLSSGH